MGVVDCLLHELEGFLDVFWFFVSVEDAELSGADLGQLAPAVDTELAGDINYPGIFMVRRAVDLVLAGGAGEEFEKGRILMSFDIPESQVVIETSLAATAINDWIVTAANLWE